MRRVKIRDLRGGLSKHLEDIPFIITKYGDDIAVVKKISQDDYLAVPKPKKTPPEKKTFCEHGYRSDLCPKSKCKKK